MDSNQPATHAELTNCLALSGKESLDSVLCGRFASCRFLSGLLLTIAPNEPASRSLPLERGRHDFEMLYSCFPCRIVDGLVTGYQLPLKGILPNGFV